MCGRVKRCQLKVHTPHITFAFRGEEKITRRTITRGTIFVFQVSAPKANHGSKIKFPSRETLAVNAFIIHLTNNTAVHILAGMLHYFAVPER